MKKATKYKVQREEDIVVNFLIYRIKSRILSFLEVLHHCMFNIEYFNINNSRTLTFISSFPTITMYDALHSLNQNKG